MYFLKYFCRHSEASPQYSAIPSGNPLGTDELTAWVGEECCILSSQPAFQISALIFFPPLYLIKLSGLCLLFMFIIQIAGTWGKALQSSINCSVEYIHYISLYCFGFIYTYIIGGNIVNVFEAYWCLSRASNT